MRGILLLLFGMLLVAGCAGPQQVKNETNQTPVPQCKGPVCGSDGQTYQTDCEAALSNVTVAAQGACVPEPDCVDSNATVTKGNETKTDSCSDADTIMDYRCVDNVVTGIPVLCGAGKECKDGRCVDKPAPPVVVNETNVSNATNMTGCVGPLAADVSKAETVMFNGKAYPDTCVEYRVVKDFFCRDNKLDSISNECPSGTGCLGGACVEQKMVCTDDDGGNDTSKTGRTIVTKGIFKVYDQLDKCVDDGKITENYCLENGSAGSQELLCPSGTKCYAGKCVHSTCSETDAGLDIYKGGVTTAKDKVDHRDICNDDYNVLEYYCYGDTVSSEIKHCPSGYICNIDTSSCVIGSKS